MKKCLFLFLIIASSHLQAMYYQLNQLESGNKDNRDLESQLPLNQTPIIDYPGIHIKQLVEKVDTLLQQNNAKENEIALLTCDVRMEKCVTLTVVILAFTLALRLALAGS